MSTQCLNWADAKQGFVYSGNKKYYYKIDFYKCSLKLQRKDHQRNAEGGYQSKKEDKIAARRGWEGKTREVGGQLQPRRKDTVDLLTFDQPYPPRHVLRVAVVDIQLWGARLPS